MGTQLERGEGEGPQSKNAGSGVPRLGGGPFGGGGLDADVEDEAAPSPLLLKFLAIVGFCLCLELLSARRSRYFDV